VHRTWNPNTRTHFGACRSRHGSRPNEAVQSAEPIQVLKGWLERVLGGQVAAVRISQSDAEPYEFFVKLGDAVDEVKLRVGSRTQRIYVFRGTGGRKGYVLADSQECFGLLAS